jgi:hypothetical protein
MRKRSALPRHGTAPQKQDAQSRSPSMMTEKYIALAFMTLAGGGLLYAVHDSHRLPASHPAPSAIVAPAPAAPAAVPALAHHKITKPPFHAPPLLAFRTTRKGAPIMRPAIAPRSFWVRKTACLSSKHHPGSSHCVCPNTRT